MRISNFHHRLARLASASALIGFLVLPFGAHAAAGTSHLSLTPNSGSIKLGDTVTVTIHENSTDPINLVESDVMYDPTKFQFVSFDNSTGAFGDPNSAFFISTQATYSATSQVINLTGALLNNGSQTSYPTLTGDQIVATVTFKALVGSGSSSLSFNPNTTVIENAGVDSWDGVTAGATFSFTGDTTATTTSPTPPPTVPAGTTTKSSSSKTTTTNVSAATPGAKPISVTPVVASTSSNTVPPSYFVAIKVEDGSGKPIKGASVTINGQNFNTDAKGIANFNHVTAGPHTVDVSYGKKHTSQAITVSSTVGGGGGSGLAVQQFKVVLGTSLLAQGLWAAAILLIIILITGGGITLTRSLKARPKLGLEQPNIAPLTATPAGPAGPSVSIPVSKSPPAKTQSAPAAPSAGTDTTPAGQVFYPDPNIQNLTPPPPPGGNKDTK